jgi:phosphatidylglycerol---prolipoprotein diacylglyceryl transferase
MYPTISDLLKDLFGINIPLPIQSFGFFVAISFLLAAYTLSSELRRKESQGLLNRTSRRILKGAPATPSELLFNGIIGFLLGFKIIYFFFHYDLLIDNPQQALVSGDGSFVGGIIVAAALVFWKWKEKNKEKQETPEWVEVTVTSSELVGNITIIAAGAGLLGAKIFNDLENIDAFLKDPIGETFSFSGLTMYGGLIFGAIAVIWYGKKNKIPALVLCDANAPGLMLAYGFGRIGCQVAGDGDWGIINLSSKPSWMSFLPDWFWRFDYAHNVINDGIKIPGCEGKHCYALHPPVFPTPLYESIVCILLFFFLWSIRKKFSVPGMLFSVYLLLNGIERFFIELIRVNTKYHAFGIDFTQAQLISLLLILTGSFGLIYFSRQSKLKANYE